MGRSREQILDFGCAESSNNRMELLAVIRVLRWIRKNRPWPDVTRVQIISDSMYVIDNIPRAEAWRRQRWRNRYGQPIENPDLWKEFLSVRNQVSMTVHFVWAAGKKSESLKEIDKAAKRAADRGGPHVDRGYGRGAISRSMVKGAADLFRANGQEAVIRVYRKNVMSRMKGETKIRFDVFSEQSGTYVESCYAYASPELANDLHRHHLFRVRFNADLKYPQILELFEEVMLP